MDDSQTFTQYKGTAFNKEEYNLGRVSIDSISEHPVDLSVQAADQAQVKAAEEPDDESRAQLNQAVTESYDVLATARTTQTLFPDTLTLDRTKLTITRRKFFSSAEVTSMRIEDVLNITATVGPLFGSIKVMSRVMSGAKPATIGLFWRKDALRMKRVIQGYIIAMQREIDCSELPSAELTEMLEMLGEDDHPHPQEVPSS
jgi:hypothetical protein